MLRVACVVCASVVLVASPALPAKIVDGPEVAAAFDPMQAIDEARRLIKDNEVPGAARLLTRVIESSGFDRLPESGRYAALWMAGAIATDQGDNATAQRLLTRASALSLAEDAVWHQRLAAAYANSDYRDSAHCIVEIAHRWPNTLGKIRAQAIHRVALQLGKQPDDANLQFELLKSLFAAAWLSDGVQPNARWRDLAILLLRRGRMAEAGRVVARIDAARLVVALRADKRFDTLVQGKLLDFDVDTISKAEIAAAEARAVPARLEPLVDLQVLLLDALQAERALAISDEVIARVADQDGAPLYEDFADQYRWILDHRALALQRLGRWDDAVTQLRRAARRPEQGEPNVSQALNLGMFYAELDRSEEALDAVADLGSLSPYGRMQLERVRLMAALDRKDAATVESHLAFMREHSTDAMTTYQDALLDAGRAREAAALLIDRLRDEGLRSDALSSMQTYAVLPQTRRGREREVLWQSVIANPAVQKELERVGRIERFNLASPRS